jgi:hypothetical protein
MSRHEVGPNTDPALEPLDTLPTALIFLALLVAAVGSLGAPLITSVATEYHVSLAAAQWMLTVSLLTGAVTTPWSAGSAPAVGAVPRRWRLWPS